MTLCLISHVAQSEVRIIPNFLPPPVHLTDAVLAKATQSMKTEEERARLLESIKESPQFPAPVIKSHVGENGEKLSDPDFHHLTVLHFVWRAVWSDISEQDWHDYASQPVFWLIVDGAHRYWGAFTFRAFKRRRRPLGVPPSGLRRRLRLCSDVFEASRTTIFDDVSVTIV